MVNCINLVIEMSPHFILGRENVPCVAEVVNRSLKADCTDYTELIELAFETNKLPIGKGICERLRKTSQAEGRYQHDKITHDKSTRAATNYFE